MKIKIAVKNLSYEAEGVIDTKPKVKPAEHPILMNPFMAKCTRDGDKNQTRRVIVHLYDGSWCLDPDDDPKDRQTLIEACPYGKVGDLLWVREQHWRYGKYVKNGLTKRGQQKWRFKIVKSEHHSGITFAEPAYKPRRAQMGWHKRPSIFMPRSLARLFLRITNVRVERLRKISGNDIYAEGVRGDPPKHWHHADNSREKFSALWNSINSKRGFGWDENPWVWAITFRKLQ